MVLPCLFLSYSHTRSLARSRAPTHRRRHGRTRATCVRLHEHSRAHACVLPLRLGTGSAVKRMIALVSLKSVDFIGRPCCRPTSTGHVMKALHLRRRAVRVSGLIGFWCVRAQGAPGFSFTPWWGGGSGICLVQRWCRRHTLRPYMYDGGCRVGQVPPFPVDPPWDR